MNRNTRLFILGALGYPALELLWRRRTHPSMALAGGLAVTALDKIAQHRFPLSFKCAWGALTITGIEWVIGQLFNQRYQVWDYRKMPLNWKGHICLHYSLLWAGLSLPAIVFLKKS
ncbi:MAG: hypothetical protein IJ461_09350 [Clostridia bacterium]|nr:hypothetical protein [Clostridia bacterium]